MPDNNPQLAEAVRAWVESHGLTQTTIAARGGPSTSTMTKVLSGRGSFRRVIFNQLDRGLDWGDGNAERYWRGEAVRDDGFDWRNVSDAELMAEVTRRMRERDKLLQMLHQYRPIGMSDEGFQTIVDATVGPIEGGQQDAGTAEDQKTATPSTRSEVVRLDRDVVIELHAGDEIPLDLAAYAPGFDSGSVNRDQERAGEENQDNRHEGE